MKGHLLTFQIPPSHLPLTVAGRQAQTLALLIRTGPTGFTSDEAVLLGWARRTSEYVRRLRQLGVPIATGRVRMPDGALVAKYTLAAPVKVLKGRDIGSTGEGTAKPE